MSAKEDLVAENNKSGAKVNAERFLQLIEQNPTFYSKRRNGATEEEKNEILSTIGKEIGLTAAQAKWLWEKLTDNYMSYLRGDKKQFALASKMKFLQSYLLNDTDSESEDGEIFQSEIMDALNDTDDVNIHFDILQNGNGALPSPPICVQNIYEQFAEEMSGGVGDDLDIHFCAKKQRTEKYTSDFKVTTDQSKNVPEPMKATGRKVANAMPSGPPTMNFSSLELLFLSYAKTIEAMPAQLKYETKYKIVDVMKEADLQLLKAQEN